MENIAKKVINRFDRRMIFIRSLPESARVLDLGCGSGNNGIAVKAIHPGSELHGVDIILQPDLPSFYSFTATDLDTGVLPFADSYFDGVFFTHVLEHLHTPLKLGGEIHRVMKKEARIYVETPNWTSVFAPSFGFRREQHNPFNFYDDPTHVKPWSKHGLFEFLSQNCGLQVLKIGNTRNWLRVPIDGLIILYGLIRGNRLHVVSSFWNLYGWCIYAVAAKE